MIRIALLTICFSILVGCGTLRPDGYGTEWKHDSGLLIGQPFNASHDKNGLDREDSLDVWNNYMYWQRKDWYAEVGVGLKLREGGFYTDGPPVLFNGRVGKRFRFGDN